MINSIPLQQAERLTLEVIRQQEVILVSHGTALFPGKPAVVIAHRALQIKNLQNTVKN